MGDTSQFFLEKSLVLDQKRPFQAKNTIFCRLGGMDFANAVYEFDQIDIAHGCH